MENAKRFCSFSLTLGKPGRHFCSALPEMFSGVYGKRHSRALKLASEQECRVFRNILWLEFISWHKGDGRKKEQSALLKKQCDGNIRTHRSSLLRSQWYLTCLLQTFTSEGCLWLKILLCRLCHSGQKIHRQSLPNQNPSETWISINRSRHEIHFGFCVWLRNL